MAISFIYRYYKVANRFDYAYIHVFSFYIHTYTRTHMNALARAYIEGIHDRFAQSFRLLLHMCVCICVYIQAVHSVQQVHNLAHMYIPVHNCMSVHVHRISRCRTIRSKNKLYRYLSSFFFKCASKPYVMDTSFKLVRSLMTGLLNCKLYNVYCTSKSARYRFPFP